MVLGAPLGVVVDGGGGDDVEPLDGVSEGVVEPDGGDGEEGELPLAATTLMASFMPLAQCPMVGHMKYIAPVVDRVMTVLPSLWDFRAFPLLQLS